VPALPPVPNVFRLVLSGLNSTRNWANVLHLAYSGAAPGSSALDGFATTVSSAWDDGLSGLAHPDVSLTRVDVVDLTSATSGEGLWEGSVVGTRSGALIAASAAALVSYVIPARYRGGHPRQYLCFGCDTDLNDRTTWTDSFVSDLQADWQGFLSDLVGSSISGATVASVGTVSYKNKTLDTPPPLYFAYNIETATVSAELATQRRRVRRTAHR
jgi:hypothetical protein